MNKAAALAGLAAVAVAGVALGASRKPGAVAPEDKLEPPPTGDHETPPGGGAPPAETPTTEDERIAVEELAAFSLTDDTAISIAQAALSVAHGSVMHTLGLDAWRGELATMTETEIEAYGMAITSGAEQLNAQADALSKYPQASTQLLAWAATVEEGEAPHVSQGLVDMIRAVAEEGLES